MIGKDISSFKSLDANDLKVHNQTYHMGLKVNIDVKEQTIIECSQCDFKCRLNIQLKKHIVNTHQAEANYNCKECGYTTDYVADTWQHTLNEHPDQSFQFTPREAENFMLKMIAQQNAGIVEELDSLKSDIKGAFDNLASVVQTSVSSIKEDTDEKCKILADTVIKLNSKFSKLETRSKAAKTKKKTSQ